MTNETTSAIDEAENHMRILRAWGTATPMWAADTIIRLRAALEEIADPLAAMRRRAEADGNRLSGMAYQIANDVGYLKKIARDALSSVGGE